MEAIGAAVAAACVLGALWVAATRRHVRGRAVADTDWHGADRKPALWTSTARCVQCGSGDGLLEDAGGELWFMCLACGHRHRRERKA